MPAVRSASSNSARLPNEFFNYSISRPVCTQKPAFPSRWRAPASIAGVAQGYGAGRFNMETFPCPPAAAALTDLKPVRDLRAAMAGWGRKFWRRRGPPDSYLLFEAVIAHVF